MADPTAIDDEAHVRAACAVARRAREHGNQPFGAVLVDAGGAVLLEAANTVVTTGDCTGHAETNLVRDASVRYDETFLAGCALVTSTEPCAMCAGAIYWSGIGRVVYGLAEEALAAMTGADAANRTMNLPARTVLAAGQRSIEVVGPVAVPEADEVHEGYWDHSRTTPPGPAT